MKCVLAGWTEPVNDGGRPTRRSSRCGNGLLNKLWLIPECDSARNVAGRALCRAQLSKHPPSPAPRPPPPRPPLTRTSGPQSMARKCMHCSCTPHYYLHSLLCYYAFLRKLHSKFPGPVRKLARHKLLCLFQSIIYADWRLTLTNSELFVADWFCWSFTFLNAISWRRWSGTNAIWSVVSVAVAESHTTRGGRGARGGRRLPPCA